MEVIEDLLLNGLKIYQDDEAYRFTSDSVLLSRFATVKKGDTVADLCAGSGIVGLHLYGLNPCVAGVTFFELQKSMCDLMEKTIALNGLSGVCSVVNTRLQDIGTDSYGKFSLVVCNPPYMPKGSGEEGEKPEIALCKREIAVTLKEVIYCAAKLVKYGGRFALVNRADRLCEIFELMRKNGLEPKRLAPVSGGKKEPYLVLVEGVKGGRQGLKILTTLEN